MISQPAPAPKSASTRPPNEEGRTPRLRRLRLAELPSDTVALARFLIGRVIVSDTLEGRTAARIIETEAYLPDDEACHAFRGETARNTTLFGRRGRAYVYFIYGNHFCLNVVSERAGVGAGVLLRAGEPFLGCELMRERRPRSSVRDVCRGPGRLAAALGVTRALDGTDLCAAGPLWLARFPSAARVPELGTSVRIGLTKEAELPLRFFERGSTLLSGPASLNR